MRKVTLSIITLAVGIGIGIFIDRALLTPNELPSPGVAIERSRTIEMVGENIEPGLRDLLDIDGQKQVVVVLTDSADSLRANPK